MAGLCVNKMEMLYMKLKNILIVLIIYALGAFAGCAETPDSVKSKNNSGNGADLEKIQKFVALKDLQKSSEDYASQICSMRFDNMTADSPLKFTVPDEIGKYKVMCIADFQDNADKLFEKYIPAADFSEKYIDRSDSVYPMGAYYDDGNTYVGVGCTGFFSFSDSSTQELLNDVDKTMVKTYDVTGFFDDNIYSLNGSEVSVSQISELAQKCADDFTSFINYPNQIKPKMITVYQHGGENGFDIIYRNLYKGLPIFNTFSAYSELSPDVITGQGGFGYCSDKNRIGVFAVQSGYEDYESVKVYDEIISPTWAVQSLSEALAEYSDYELVSMELAYVPFFSGNTVSEAVNENQQGTALINSYDVHELIPYWIFYFDVTMDKEIYGMVNCITGEVEFVNNAK